MFQKTQLTQMHEGTHHKKSAYTNGLPDDELTKIETCRRHQEFN
jgi:hypothetical protein